MELVEEITKYRQEIKSERMDMSFGEIVNMFRDGEIIISPEYQRAFRWDEQRQSDFIESILLGIPFPSIFVATNSDGKWELIDGLQRISTVLSFFGELKEDGKDYPKNKLILKEGSLVKKLNGLTIDTLPLEYKLQIKRTPCRVEVNDFVDNLSRNTKFRKLINISQSKEEMMYYEELVLRYFTLKNAGIRYTQSNIQDYMDDYLKKRCEDFNPTETEKDSELFNKIMDFLIQFQEDDIFKLGRRIFSTSMYDAIMLSLSENSVDLSSINRKDFLSKINELKADTNFNSYVGSASSNTTSITNKVKIAKRILLGIER